MDTLFSFKKDKWNQDISLLLRIKVTARDMDTSFLSRNHMKVSYVINKKKNIISDSKFLFLTSLVQVQFECETLDDDGMKS
jgi:hypothetical protein